jgi:hypothetical protein
MMAKRWILAQYWHRGTPLLRAPANEAGALPSVLNILAQHQQMHLRWNPASKAGEPPPEYKSRNLQLTLDYALGCNF